MTRRRGKRKPRGGGGARNPNSIANLRRGPQPGLEPRRSATRGRCATAVAPRSRSPASTLRGGTFSPGSPTRLRCAVPMASYPPPTRRPSSLPHARLPAIARWTTGSSVHGVLDEKTGEPKKAVWYAESSARTADGLLAKLGMNPKDRAALGLDIARTSQFDLARHWAESETVEGEAEEEDDAPEA